MSSSFLRRFTKRTLVAINSTVALLFLLGCYGSHLEPKFFWFTGFLTLSAFYLGLVLLLFVFFWILFSPKYTLISIVSLLLAWMPLKHLVKLRLDTHFELVKKPKTLRVMSWNVEHFDILEHKKHPEGKTNMINMINQYQPDIACFQEMVGSDKNPDAINYIPDFEKRLQMAGYNYSYNPKLDFDGKHHFGIVTFSKYPILYQKTISYPPHDYNSIFQYTDIVMGKDTFRIINLHLQSLKFSNDNLQYIKTPSIENKTDIEKSKNIVSKFKKGFLLREIQSKRIRVEIDESPYPVVVCGDFNDVPNSYAYNTIGKGLQNAFAEKGTGIGRTFNGISPTLRIDNIFADKRFEVTQFLRIKKNLSDHFPVIADLYFKNE